VSHIFCPAVGERVAAMSRASGVVAAVVMRLRKLHIVMLRASMCRHA